MDIPLPGETIPGLGDLQPTDIPMPESPMPESPLLGMPAFGIPMPEDPPDSSFAESTTSEPSQEETDEISQPPPPLPPDPPPVDDEDDPNRYSPTFDMDEDEPEPDPEPVTMPAESGIAMSLLAPPPPPPVGLLAPPSPSPSPSPPSFTFPTRSPSRTPSPPPQKLQTTVLGKMQAKKRLLAFSMTKQGGGAGVSFNLKKTPAVSKESAKGFAEDKEDVKKKPSKKGAVDKARDTISEIEELKRRELEMIKINIGPGPHWSMRDISTIAAPIQLAGEALAKISKRDEEKQKRRSSSRERRRSKSKKSDKDKHKEKSKRLKMPSCWKNFKADGHTLHKFRQFKHKVEKEESRRHRRSRSRSRDRKKDKDSSSKSKSKRINILEAPMVIKKVLTALNMNGTGDVEYPEYLVKYTKVRPSLSYCGNPKAATYHLQKRSQMLASVPKDIEEIIMHFLHSIRPKRLIPGAKVGEVSDNYKNVIESYTNEGEAKLGDVGETSQIEDNIDTVSAVNKAEIIAEINMEDPKESIILQEDNAENQDIELNNKGDGEVTAVKEENEMEEVEGSIKVEDGLDKKSSEDLSEDKLKVESCDKAHRLWMQKPEDWLAIPIPLEEEEDIEIEELDVPNVQLNKSNNNNSQEITEIDGNLKEKKNYKPRSRNISQSSNTVITEELEPIIKSATRSKWDSDYEESEEDKHKEKGKDEVNAGEDSENYVNGQKPSDILELQDDIGVVPMEVEDDDKNENELSLSEKFVREDSWQQQSLEADLVSQPEGEKQGDFEAERGSRHDGVEQSDAGEKLASEYEEFMKMLGTEDHANMVSEEEHMDKSLKMNDSVHNSNWDENTSEMDTFSHHGTSMPIIDSQLPDSSQVVEDSSQPDISNNKQHWAEKQRSKRSKSESSNGSIDLVTIQEALIKQKMLSKAIKKTKKKSVKASKIKKKSKDKGKKSKKKNKKHSSSDSSTSSSSSSDSSTSSSSSSSSSDDSSSESSSDSSSSDSSIDLKKLKKQKLKKLKAKLKLRKKKKQVSSSSSSSSASSESSEDEDVKKKKKKKSRVESKLKKKKNREKSEKDAKNKKKKNNKSISDASETTESVLIKKQKNKRKIIDDENEMDKDIPKKKKIKVNSELVTFLKNENLELSGKHKKTSKIEKGSKKKEGSKKEKGLKKKHLKDKTKEKNVDEEMAKTLSKSSKKNKKTKKDKHVDEALFLELGQSLKTYKKGKTSDKNKGLDIDNVFLEGDSSKKTGIKMSEEDFDIPFNKTSAVISERTPVCKDHKDAVEHKLPFLGQNKRLTEEDFEVNIPVEKNSKKAAYEVEGNEPLPFISVDEESGFDEKKTKKEKRNKKGNELKDDVSNNDFPVDRKKKRKKEKKSKKSSEKSKDKSKKPLSSNDGEEDQVFSNQSKNLSVPEERCVSSGLILNKEPISWDDDISPPKNGKRADNWSDDSETRGMFIRHEKIVELQQESPDHLNEKRNLNDSYLTCNAAVIDFESQNEDVVDKRNSSKTQDKKRNKNKKKVKSPNTSSSSFLDEVSSEDIDGIRKRRNNKPRSKKSPRKQLDSSNEGIEGSDINGDSCNFTKEVLGDSLNSPNHSVSLKPIENMENSSFSSLEQNLIRDNVVVMSKIKELSSESSLIVNEDSHNSIILEKDSPSRCVVNDNKILPTIDEHSEDPLHLLLDNSELDKSVTPKADNSERYSPTLDLDGSPVSNERADSDMSLDSDQDSNVPETCIDMLDIPLPPSSMPFVAPPLPPLIKVPTPVPPPVLPVPPPSFKNILNFPVKPPPPLPPPETNKIIVQEQQKITEFKTAMTPLITSSDIIPTKPPQPLPHESTNDATEGKPKITAFKTSMSALNTSIETKPMFTDPLKIPITKKINLGKPPVKLKPINIFEDDDADEGEGSNQGLSKLPSELELNPVPKSTFDLAIERAEEKLKQKTPINDGSESFAQKSLKESERKEKEDAIQQICASLKASSEEKTSEQKINECVSMEKSNDETNSSNNTNSLINIQFPNVEVENARHAWRDSDETISTMKSVPDSKNISNENQKEAVDIFADQNNAGVILKTDHTSQHETMNENIGNSNFDLNIQIKQEPESDISQEEHAEERKEHVSDLKHEKIKQTEEEEKKKKEYDDYRSLRRRDSSRERKDRSRRDSSRDRRRNRSRSRSRDRKRDRSRDRHRRDSPERRRRRDRSRERSRRGSSRDRRRERSPRGRRESSRDRSPRKTEGTLESRASLIEKHESERNEITSDKNYSEMLLKQTSPVRRSQSPYKSMKSPRRSLSPRKRSPSPLLRSPLYHKRSLPHRSPSPTRRASGNRSPSPRRVMSPRRGSPRRSPQRRQKSPQRRPPSPKSPYRSPSPHRRSPARGSSPSKRYFSPRRPQSPWRPPSPQRRVLSPVRRPLSPWRPPSPKQSGQPPDGHPGRNPSPLGFKRSLADSTISDSDLLPIKKITRCAVLSPKRLPLDDRIELELGVKKSPPPPPPPGDPYPEFHSFYQIPVHDGGRRTSNLVQPPRLDWDASQQLLRKAKSTQVLQVQ